MSNTTENELKLWLTSALKSENLSNLSVTRVGNSEKGDGYMGDILFVKVSAKTSNNTPKTYHLALKCSKQNSALREAMPVKAAFENEIYLYSRTIPAFTQFQKKKGIEDIFNSVPNYYGSYVSEDTEVLVFEDLKMGKYYLADRKKPLPAKHLKLILNEYGKWHAISAAMQDQEPDEFKRILLGIKSVWKMFIEKIDVESFFSAPMEETYELVKSSLSTSTAEKLRNFKTQVIPIMNDVINEGSHFSVITHGDCWNNNFMFKSENDNGKEVLRVAMLDWQTAKFSSPVLDISYFIYACASEEMLNNFNGLLECYYSSFANYMKVLGSDPSRIYPFSQLRNDFKYFGKYGVMLTLLAVKVALSDKEEAPDFAENTDHGLEKTFSFKNRNPTLLRDRMLYIIKHIDEQDML